MKNLFNPLLKSSIQKIVNSISDLTDHNKANHDSLDIDADTLDGLHDTGYTKTTAGQTINVSTAAELTAALAALAAAPSLLGNVIILCAAGTYTGNWIVPALLYNGFTLTIEGELTEVLSDTATGGASPGGADNWTTNTPAYAEKTTANWTVDAYKNLLLYNPAATSVGKYTAIISNTATKINYSCHSVYFTVFANTNTIKVYDWGTKLTTSSAHTIECNEASVIFKNIWIDNTSTTYGAVKSAKKGCIDFYQCKCSGTWAGATVRGESNSIYKMYACVVFGLPAVRMDTRSLMYNVVMPNGSHGGSNFIALSGASRVILLNNNSSFFETFGAYIDGISTGTCNGLEAFTGSAACSNVFVWNCPGTGVKATLGGIITGTTSSGFTNNGTNKNPAAAADPAYIS